MSLFPGHNLTKSEILYAMENWSFSSHAMLKVVMTVLKTDRPLYFTYKSLEKDRKRPQGIPPGLDDEEWDTNPPTLSKFGQRFARSDAKMHFWAESVENFRYLIALQGCNPATEIIGSIPNKCHNAAPDFSEKPVAREDLSELRRHRAIVQNDLNRTAHDKAEMQVAFFDGKPHASSEEEFSMMIRNLTSVPPKDGVVPENKLPADLLPSTA